MSSVTKKIYIDAERKAYLFFSEKEAEQFIFETENTQLGDNTFKTPQDFFSNCYRNGALCVVLCDNGFKEEAYLSKKEIKKDFYNAMLNAGISLFKETKEQKYLKIISSCMFIIPIRINFEVTPEIVYGVLHTSANEYKFIAFSDLEEYDTWAENMSGWQPLLVNFDVMCQISKENGYVINPKGNSLVFPARIMEKYRKYSK